MVRKDDDGLHGYADEDLGRYDGIGLRRVHDSWELAIHELRSYFWGLMLRLGWQRMYVKTLRVASQIACDEIVCEFTYALWSA